MNWEFLCFSPVIDYSGTESRSNQNSTPLPNVMSTPQSHVRIAKVTEPLRCAILISGSGSGMEAMLHHQRTSNCLHRTEVVISNVADAYGIERAKHHECPVEIIELPTGLTGVERRLSHEKAIEKVLAHYRIELIILSGYMRLLSADFVDRWAGKVVNIHPSLLPDFPGAHAHRDVIAAGVTKTGCTVHYVDAGMDTGQIIAQCEVEVLADDTEASLASRVKEFEHKLYPLVIDAIASGDFSDLPGN